MSRLLSITWYVDEPIDFEYKQYILYDYLQNVDSEFYQKKLSPHLLHMEKIFDELISFNSSFDLIKHKFDQNRYVYFDNSKLQGEDNELLYEVRDIVDLSISQIEPRIKLGYKILKKNNQI